MKSCVRGVGKFLAALTALVAVFAFTASADAAKSTGDGSSSPSPRITIPQIDVSALVSMLSDDAKNSDNLHVQRQVGAAIARACQHVGFFTMVGHGLDEGDAMAMGAMITRRAHEFFSLETHHKMQVAGRRWNPESPMQYRGYFPATANGKEGLDIGNILPEATRAYDIGRFVRHGALEEATVLPPPSVLPPGWHDDVQDYYKRMMGLSRMLLRAFSLHWGYTSDFIENQLLPPTDAPSLSTLRFNMYPGETTMPRAHALGDFGLRADENASLALSCDTHTDGVVFTLLHQGDVGGLQVQGKDNVTGETYWVDVPVVPGAIVVNTGVALQRVVNGRWNATNHRVVWSGQARLSVPFFFEASYNAIVQPLANAVAVSPNKRPMYRPVRYGPYMIANNRRHKEYNERDMKEDEESLVDVDGDADGIRAAHLKPGADTVEGDSQALALQQTVSFIHNTQFEDLPADVVREVKRALLDTLGVAIGARTTELASIVKRYVKTVYPAPADPPVVECNNNNNNTDESLHTRGTSLWLDGTLVSMPGAALANGLLVDALDMHDSGHNAKGHAGAALVPAALALVDGIAAIKGHAAPPMTGRELLTMVAVGYEVAYRAGEILVGSAVEYHSSGAWNAVGVAAMAARRMGLSTDETLSALGTAEYYAPRSPVMRVMGKPTNLKDGSGWGAMVGLSGALLAADGFTGGPSALVENMRADLWAQIGQEWHILRYHVYKRHATCYWAQASVNGAITLREKVWTLSSSSSTSSGERTFQPPALPVHAVSQVVDLEIQTFPEALALFQGVPNTTDEAQYSLCFAVAAALVHGVVGPAQLTGAGLHDADTLQVFGRTRATLHPRFATQALHESVVHENWAEVVLTLADGTRVSSGPMFVEWDHFRGQAAPSDGELKAKFLWLAGEKDSGALLDGNFNVTSSSSSSSSSSSDDSGVVVANECTNPQALLDAIWTVDSQGSMASQIVQLMASAV